MGAGTQAWRARLLQAQLLLISKANPSRCVPWSCPPVHSSLASDSHVQPTFSCHSWSLSALLKCSFLWVQPAWSLIEVSPCPTLILLGQTSGWLPAQPYLLHTNPEDVSWVPQPSPENPHSSNRSRHNDLATPRIQLREESPTAFRLVTPFPRPHLSGHQHLPV